MAILQTCCTKGCETKTLGRFCLDCETASSVAEPAAIQFTLVPAPVRDLAPAA
jgi:hypothetical protein